MDRVLRPSAEATPGKTAKSEGYRFLLPGADSWELWNKTAAGSLERVGNADLGALDGRWSPSSFLAIPMQYAVVIPLWLATTDKSLMSEMVWLQLERKGLLDGSRAQTVMDYRVVREESGRSLLSVSVLSDHFPEDMGIKGIFRYPLVADLLVLPANQLVLWKELERQILVFTSGDEVVYSQSFSKGEADAALTQEAFCAFLQLQSEDILSTCSGVTVWGDGNRHELESLARVLGAPLSFQGRPAPQIPASPRNLMPYSVKVQQENRRKGERARRIWSALGVAYLLMLAMFLGHYGWLFWKKTKIEKDLALHRQEVQTIRNTAGRWEAMELAIMPETYPVEMLYRCTRPLPEEGVRLVTFTQTGTGVFMAGEAKSSAAAFQFLQDLKKSKDLASYHWEMPPPKLLPNDAATFQIEGKRSYAPANSQ